MTMVSVRFDIPPYKAINETDDHPNHSQRHGDNRPQQRAAGIPKKNHARDEEQQGDQTTSHPTANERSRIPRF